jgi:hypothetical protein
VSELGPRLDVPAPGEVEAGRRSWRVVRTAFAGREPEPPRRQPSLRLAAVAVAVVAVGAAIAAAATPAGRDLVDGIRRTVGIADAKPALASLPAPGRVLVAGPDGAWVIDPDGGGRRLGAYPDASWSPFGRFVVAVGPGRRELVALEPNGDVRWSLGRPGPIRMPRWGGTETDTRIAYLSGRALRVVAGDGTGDHILAPRVAAVAPSWRPGTGHVLSFVDPAGDVVTVDTDTQRVRWRAPTTSPVRELEWSADGRQLLVRATGSLAVLDALGRHRSELVGPEAAPAADASFAGGGVAFVQWTNGGSTVWLATRQQPAGGAARRVFEGAGRISGVHRSPDGRWLLLTWPSADQWVFVRTAGRPRVDAVGGIAARFGSTARVAGWCC